MNVEIEAKIKVDSHTGTIEQLHRLGAESLVHLRQEDTFLIDDDRSLPPKGCGLRIRRETRDDMDRIDRITFKGPRQASEYKSREEIELEISDGNALEAIFHRLGYKPALTVRKTRRMWRLDNCEVCLDEVEELGRFIEIEGPDEESIRRTLERLNLDAMEIIHKGYASMLAKLHKQS